LTLNRFFCGCNYMQARWSFDSKPTLSMFATICRRNRKCYSLPSTFKAEARFRVKTKAPPEAIHKEQFPPNIFGADEYIIFRCFGIREFVVVWL